MRKDIYKIDNSVEKILNGKNTLFLDVNEFKLVASKLKKKDYNVYYPYKDSEKVILYVKSIPKVTLFKIKSYSKLRHQDILGAILSLNISSSYLGDIIIDNDNYYFYIISDLSDFIKNNLNIIGNTKVLLEEIDLTLLENYERKYKELETIVSSLRIDTVISRIIKINREEVINKIKNKEVLLNHEVLTKNSYILKENDIFSIKRYGKYKYIDIVNNTKKNNLVIKYLQYL